MLKYAKENNHKEWEKYLTILATRIYNSIKNEEFKENSLTKEKIKDHLASLLNLYFETEGNLDKFIETKAILLKHFVNYFSNKFSNKKTEKIPNFIKKVEISLISSLKAKQTWRNLSGKGTTSLSGGITGNIEENNYNLEDYYSYKIEQEEIPIFPHARIPTPDEALLNKERKSMYRNIAKKLINNLLNSKGNTKRKFALLLSFPLLKKSFSETRITSRQKIGLSVINV